MSEPIVVHVTIVRAGEVLGHEKQSMPGDIRPDLMLVEVMEAARNAGVEASRKLLSERTGNAR